MGFISTIRLKLGVPGWNAVRRQEQPVHFRPAIPEDSPGDSLLLNGIQIEAGGENGLGTPVRFG